MNIRTCLILLPVLIGLQMLAVGRDTSPQDATTQNSAVQNPDNGSNASRSVPPGALSAVLGVNGQSENDEDMPHIPAMLGGKGTSLTFLSEMERSNYLRAGVNFGVGYNDNALLGSGSQVGNTTYSVFPNIAIDQSTTRMRWSLGYAAGLTVNQQLSNQNQGAHTLNFDSDFRLSPHMNLRAAENFSKTSGIFGANGGSDLQSGTGGSNGTLITPLASQMSTQTVVETNYHFARKDIVGASGSLYDLHFSNVSTGPGTLTDSRTAAGSGFWLHELFHRDWVGISYRYQNITYDPNGATKAHTFAIIDTVTISKAFHLTGFIGPEHSNNRGVAATGLQAGQSTTFSGWGVSGGLDGGWEADRTSVTAGFSKGVSDGGGLLGAVHLLNVHGSVRHELHPGWAASFLASYGSNQAITLATSTTATSIKSTLLGVSLERNIGKSLGFRVGYSHIFQDQYGSVEPAQNYNAGQNRVFVTLSYEWAKPLGR